jgi:large subunit ribosomal protein L3
MGFSPRKRSVSPIPHFSSWPDLDGGSPKVQGFAGYKAGMTHAAVVDYRPTSTTSGQEVQVPVTVVEVPPMRVAAVRLYRREAEGLKTVAEVWSPKLDKELGRVFPIPKDYEAEEAWKKVDPAATDEVRLITYTQPGLLTGVPKTKPDLMENRVGGGSIADRIAYAKRLLGTEISVTEFCREGSMVDVAAITKGKGWKGVHTRWGTRLLSHKNSKHRRQIGTLGNFQPGYVRPTVPQGGQTGYHQRTEYNKRILKIGEKGEEITPSGGFVSYGIVRNPYVLLHGSIPGPTKRLIRFRDAARGGYVKLEKSPELTYISRESKQGA